jgi:hypothetical protein
LRKEVKEVEVAVEEVEVEEVRSVKKLLLSQKRREIILLLI